MVARAPRRRMYRTMQGRMVDIEKLRAANESVRAVGNMNVNARGDVLGPGGQIATTKANVIAKYYEQPKGKVDDTRARAKPTHQRKTPPTPVQKMTPVESKPTAKPVETFKPKTPTEKKGIDAALDGLE
jgi:hypothetical protein